MMATLIDDLETLHARLIDAIAGYAEGADLAEKPDIVDLFTRLRDMHGRHAEALATVLVQRGVQPDDDESLLAVVHKSILRIRSIVTGLDRDVIPGIVDGEERIAEIYDRVLTTLAHDPTLTGLLSAQRQDITAMIAEMRGRIAQDRNNPA
jgi:uncharacterized protein (TIGR02284 family)